jgi:hypothetical protein
MSDIPNIFELKNQLKANPIFALSLSSRELFHSNFLGWMFETYPQMIAAVYDGPVSNIHNVFREKKNLDLVIEFGPQETPEVIVIEIKVKDVPKLEQLTRYDEKIAKDYKDNVHKILLSLAEAPKSVVKDKVWDCQNFVNLGKRIKLLIPNVSIDSDHEIIIRLYANLCNDLGMLVAEANKTDEKNCVYFFNRPEKNDAIKGIDDAIKDVGFEDTLNKHRASLLHEKIKEEIQSRGLVDQEGFTIRNTSATVRASIANAKCNGHSFYAGFGLDNKTAHVGTSVFLNLSNKKNSKSLKLSLGIHIQGMYYRRMLDFAGYKVLSRADGKDHESIEAFIAQTDGWNWMFGSSHNDRKFNKIIPQGGFFKDAAEVLTRQQASKLLCSYAPIHIYQHTKIGDLHGVPVDKVVDAVIADLIYAEELLNDPSYIERFEKWPQKS